MPLFLSLALCGPLPAHLPVAVQHQKSRATEFCARTPVCRSGAPSVCSKQTKGSFDEAVAASDAGDAVKLGAVIRVGQTHARFLPLHLRMVLQLAMHARLLHPLPSVPVPNQGRDQEAFGFAEANNRPGRQPVQLEPLSAAVGAGDMKTYAASVKKLKLAVLHPALHWICFLRCRDLHPRLPAARHTPLFTHVGIYPIPTTSSAGTSPPTGRQREARVHEDDPPRRHHAERPGDAPLEYRPGRPGVQPGDDPSTPARGKVAPTIIGRLEFSAYDNTLNVWYPDTRPVGVKTAYGPNNIPQPGSTFISTGPLDVTVDPGGWIQVPRMNDYTQGGIGRFVPGGGLAGTDALINLDTTQFTNENVNLGALAVGDSIPAGDLSPRPMYAVRFEARVHVTTSPVATNTLRGDRLQQHDVHVHAPHRLGRRLRLDAGRLLAGHQGADRPRRRLREVEDDRDRALHRPTTRTSRARWCGSRDRRSRIRRSRGRSRSTRRSRGVRRGGGGSRVRAQRATSSTSSTSPPACTSSISRRP